MDQVLSRLGLRPKPLGFRLPAGRRASSFSGPRVVSSRLGLKHKAMRGLRLRDGLGVKLRVKPNCLDPSGDTAISGPEAGRGVDSTEKGAAAGYASPTGKIADRNPSPAKGLLRRGFLLCLGTAESGPKGTDKAGISSGKEWTSVGDGWAQSAREGIPESLRRGFFGRTGESPMKEVSSLTLGGSEPSSELVSALAQPLASSLCLVPGPISLSALEFPKATGVEQVHLAETSVSSHSSSLLPVAGHSSEALALGDRLRWISGLSENGTSVGLNKQMLRYYRRAKKERGSRVNDSLLLEAVESLSALLVQYHSNPVAGLAGFTTAQVKLVPKNTNPMRGNLRRGFPNPS
jgi:hypothetical protein